MNSQKLERYVEVGAVAGGIVALVGLFAAVIAGRMDWSTAGPIILTLLSALGYAEVGRRKGKRAEGPPNPDLRDPKMSRWAALFDRAGEVLELLDATEEKARVSETSPTDPREPEPTGSTADATLPSHRREVLERIESAEYEHLQKVAAHVPDVKGSGPGVTHDALEAALYQADHDDVTQAFAKADTDSS
ncbi:hypothetical protein [Halococcus sp. PRR34]|uniref:hypothetical protein n=1 Tax=Halococcus sp. PRR34 TaxID=3020830 RepID=UPI00235F7A16|nr:hypothetical protein [Halococcus sp. PRR34]